MEIIIRIIAGISFSTFFIGLAGIQDMGGNIQVPCVIMMLIGGAVMLLISKCWYIEDQKGGKYGQKANSKRATIWITS